MARHYDVIIIGGGQAGLAMGQQLARHGVDFLILDAAPRTGDAWRKRWDSLTLFTPARYSALPGLPFPAEPDHLPRKDEVAAYLESYARHFDLPIRHGETVERLRYISDWRGFTIETQAGTYEADQVVVATGPFQTPIIPSVARTLGSQAMQLHSSAYRGPAQLPDRGAVMVVGAGNSGVQIATELAQTRPTWLSVGQRLPALPQRVAGRNLFWWLDTLGMMDVPVHTRIGRRMSRREFLIGSSATECARRARVRLTSRVVSADGNVVFTTDGAAIDVAAIIWATGFNQEFGWIDAPVFDDAGRPLLARGVSPVTGLYFLGLPWQHTRGSALLGWVGRDAAFLAQRIAIS